MGMGALSYLILSKYLTLGYIGKGEIGDGDGDGDVGERISRERFV